VTGLDADALVQLRSIVSELQAANANGGTSLSAVVRLAREVSLSDAGVTLDFGATPHLGQPLVLVRVPPVPVALTGLTPREHQVAALIADGLSNKEIAQRLHLSVGTVKHYVHQILEKTRLPSRVAIATRLRGA
jgi:DNA-binding NarL/FixJ family response regulator